MALILSILILVLCGLFQLKVQALPWTNTEVSTSVTQFTLISTANYQNFRMHYEHQCKELCKMIIIMILIAISIVIKYNIKIILYFMLFKSDEWCGDLTQIPSVLGLIYFHSILVSGEILPPPIFIGLTKLYYAKRTLYKTLLYQSGHPASAPSPSI